AKSWDPRLSPLAAGVAGSSVGAALVGLCLALRVWHLQQTVVQLSGLLEDQAQSLDALTKALDKVVSARNPQETAERRSSALDSWGSRLGEEMLPLSGDSALLASNSWKHSYPSSPLSPPTLYGYDLPDFGSSFYSGLRERSYRGGSDYGYSGRDYGDEGGFKQFKGSDAHSSRSRRSLSLDSLRSHTRYHEDYGGFDAGGDLYKDDLYSDDAYADGFDDLDSDFYGFGNSRSAWGDPEQQPHLLRAKLRQAFLNRTQALEASLIRRSSCADASEWRIPRVLHQTWKTSEVPAKFEGLLSSWRRLHPDWRFEFWDDRSSRELIATTFPQHLKAYDRMSGIKRADVARLVVLYVIGGVYADIDVEATRPLDELLDAACDSMAGLLLGEENFVHSVLLEKKTDWLVSNAVMAGSKGHSFWEEVIREIFSNSYCGDDPVQCTGPRLVDRLSWQHLQRSPACSSHGCVVRLPFDYFSPNIARWNAGNMIRECGDTAKSRKSFARDSYASRGRRGDDSEQAALVRKACSSLSHVLQSPSALQSNRTYTVHHWQCSWCRQDETLERRIPLDAIIWRVGNESLKGFVYANSMQASK
ncbi:unnamed protein product, partial [Polarella glacialis]